MDQPYPDPFQAIVDSQRRLATWIDSIEKGPALGVVDPGSGRMECSLRDHFLLLDDRILPALLVLDPAPAVAALVAELRREHVAILADCGRLCRDLAGCLVHEHAGECEHLTRDKALDIQARVIASTTREQEQVLPLVERHREALARSLAA